MKFGLYTSFFNCENFVESAFYNIENINYENFEWHITDDFSNDNNKTITKIKECISKSKIKDKIFYHHQQEKKEMYWKPNIFFDRSIDWIVLIDADDKIDKNSLLIYSKLIKNDTVLITSDFHKIKNNSLYSISYILNDEIISNKINRYHPHIDYLNNLSYSCFGSLRAFKNLPSIQFNVKNMLAGAEDSYRIFWCNYHGKYLHIPRPLYKWLMRDNSESHSGTFGPHFNDNFNFALDRLKLNDGGIDSSYNHLYKETCALSSYRFGELTGRKISLYTRYLNPSSIDLLKELYFDTHLSINPEAISEINIIVANFFNDNELILLLNKIKDSQVLLYYQNDKYHQSNKMMDEENENQYKRLSSLFNSHFNKYSYFKYIRHIILYGDK